MIEIDKPKLYDLIRLLKEIPSENLKAGSIGTILLIYDGSKTAYEVEFSDFEGVPISTSPTITLFNESFEIINLYPCPCCGYATLMEKCDYEICPVCWWEDDGQDNEDADEIRNGPNYQWSLTQARINFINYGISCPDREDLKSKIKNPSSFKRIRFFTITSEGKVIEGD